MRLKKLLDIIESEILAELQNISLHEAGKGKAKGDDGDGEDDGEDDPKGSSKPAPTGKRLDMRKGKGSRGGTRTSAGTVGKVGDPPRELGADGTKQREKIGDKMIADPKVMAKFKAKYGDEETAKSHIWATASDIVARKKYGGERKGGRPKKKVDAPMPDAPKGKPSKLKFKSKGYKKPVAKKAKQSKDPEQTSLDLK